MTNLVINTQTISQHNGLFSLNDLHKVSGNEKKHEPFQFMRNQQTKDLIAEIESENQIAYNTINGGKNRGTYVCRELVYAYAMWISAKFHLMVIRAFEALNTGAIPCLLKTTKTDRLPLKNAVNMLVAKSNLMYDEAYRMVHQYMGVEHIDQIPLDDLPKAVEYVHGLILGSQPKVDKQALYKVLCDSAVHLRDYMKMLKTLKALPMMSDTIGRTMFEQVIDNYNDIVQLSQSMHLTNCKGLPMFTPNAINYYGGNALIFRN